MLVAAALLLAAQPAAEEIGGCPGGFTFFATDSARLDTQALQHIEMVLGWTRPMVEGGGWFILAGSADDTASPTENMALSRRRAEAVRDYLQRRGFRDEQIRLRPQGDTRPLVELQAGHSDAQNRNVIIAPEMPMAVFLRFFPPGAPIC